MRIKLCVLLLALATARAFASPAPERWLQLRSDHFIILTDSSEKDARRIAIQFELMRTVFHALLPTAAVDADAPITVIALKDRKEFQSIEPAAYLAKGKLELAGLFLRTPDRNYILVRLDTSASEEHPYATVYHEYTHFLNRKADWLPLWLNEGFAEFYQNTDIDDKEVRLGQPSREDILYLREHSLLPLATLFAVDHASPYYHDEQKFSVFYSESWALTHFLIINDRIKNTHRLQDYTQNLSDGEDPLTAAQNAFGDLKRLQQALDAYVQQGVFDFFKMPLVSNVDEASLHVQTIATADADAVRADVLLYNGRKEEALALVESALEDDPQNALAHETMGFLKYRDGDIQAARKWYAEAVQLDSQSYLAQYFYATLSLQSGDTADDVTVESSLRDCIRLNPSFAPAFDELARFYASRNRNLREAHILNAQAIALEPGEISYRLNAALVLMQQKQPGNAILVLKAAEHVAKDPNQLAIVQARLQQIEQSQAGSQIFEARRANGPAAEPGAGLGPSVTTETETATASNGRLVAEEGHTEPLFPTASSTGPHRTVRGRVRDVKCYYPAVLSLSLQPDGQNQQAKPVTLYMNNYFKVDFYTLNFRPSGDLKPCTDIEGMNASIDYSEVSSPVAAGQILKVELSK